LGQIAKNVRFKDILTHNAFFDSYISYNELKENVAVAAMSINMPSHYSNTNFALIRILIPIINCSLDRNMNYGIFNGTKALNDFYWDVLTRKYFNEFAHEHLWTKSGVPYARLQSMLKYRNQVPFKDVKEITNCSLACPYPSYAATVGVDASSYCTGIAGAVGWHLSVNELLIAAHKIKRTIENLTQDLI